VWNVAWVAHALTTDPASVFDANIFYPHKQALAFSEANFVAGIVAIPVWVTTKNPYAAYNTVVLLAFAGAALAGYLLVRVLGGSRFGAAIAGGLYGFSPYMFAHIPHIQLLMTFGPALSMAAFHHFSKAPSVRRGLTLGGALTLTGLACAYYGIYSALMVGVGLVWTMCEHRRWRDRAFWGGILAAGAVVTVVIGPLFVPYLSIQEAGFGRSLADARLHATVGRAYFASAALVHRWMLPLLGEWREVLFPGFHGLLLSGCCIWLAIRRRPGVPRSLVGLYVLIAVLAVWVSLGPDGGLYTLLYYTVPAFSFLRASARFGLLVTLSVAVLSGLALTWMQQRHWRAAPWLAVALVVVALAESYVGPLQLINAPRVVQAYQRLALMPRAPVVEVPFYTGPVNRHRQTEYMLPSTFHWQPLVNGYSDHWPAEYTADAQALATFPSGEAFEVIRQRQVRWLVVHFNQYSADERRILRPQLRAMRDQLRLVVDDYDVSLYEVIWPRRPAAFPRP
jgi:hypothetical protein